MQVKEKIDIKMKAVNEMETKGQVDIKCPVCNGNLEVELLGNSARIKCPCGYMNDSLRGI